jgi:hypothetical protein
MFASGIRLFSNIDSAKSTISFLFTNPLFIVQNEVNNTFIRYKSKFVNPNLRNTRIEMSPAERRQFYEKHIRHMTLTIDENGNVSIELKRG